MEAVLRKLKLRRSDGKDSEARKKLQKSLFAFEKTLLVGFPTHSISFAVDVDLGLMAIASQFGDLRVYGKPGLQFCHKLSSKAEHLYFLPEQARLLTLCFDGTIQLLELNVKNGTTSVTNIKSFTALTGEEKSKWIPCISSDFKTLTYCSSASSDVQQFDVESFVIKEKILTRQTIHDIMPEESKESNGNIVSIVQFIDNTNKYLLGFSHGVIVMWDSEIGTSSIACSAVQPMENMYMNGSMGQLMTAHTDGSYMTWKFVDNSLKFEDKVTPYGPFPCEAIRKIVASKCPAGDTIVIFSGGSGRSSFDNDYMITLAKGPNNYIFDETTSKVVDFQVAVKNGAAEWLFILWEHQIACVNLKDSGYPAIDTPLFTTYCLAPISCLELAQNVDVELIQKLRTAGGDTAQRTAFSDIWPLKGGEVDSPDETNVINLLIVGHENGDISFWQDELTGFEWLCTWSMTHYFKVLTSNNLDPEATPKVNKYAPAEFDPHFAILKMAFETSSRTLTIAGANGQIIVATLNPGEATTADTITVEFSDHGEEVLVRKNGVIKSDIATIDVFIQILPPRPCTAIAYKHQANILAAATNDGFAIFDLTQKKVIFTKCTPAMCNSVTRSMSFSNTLRESFRNLKKRVPSPHHAKKSLKPTPTSDENKEAPQQPEETLTAEIVEEVKEGVEKTGQVVEEVKEGVEKMASELKDTIVAEVEEKKEVIAEAVEKVEKDLKELVNREESDAKVAPMSPERIKDDKQVTFDTTTAAPTTPSKTYTVTTPLHPVSAFHFNETFIIQNATTSASLVLMAGTRNGHVLIYQIILPQEEARNTEDVSCCLAKELHLKHGASIVSLMVVDRIGKPVVTGSSGDTHDAHRLVVVSQEQIKIFNLPSLKPYNKYKFFSPNSDAHIRYIRPVLFQSNADDEYSEWGVACIANNGHVTVLNLLQLRPQLKVDLDMNEAHYRKAVVSTNGVGFYIINDGFDLQKFSLSVKNPGHAHVSLHLKEGMRPIVEVAEETAAMEMIVTVEGGVATENEGVTKGEEQIKKVLATGVNNAASIAGDSEVKQNGVDKVAMLNVGHHVTNGYCNGETGKILTNEETEEIGEPFLVMESSEIIENNMSTTTRMVTMTTASGEKTESKTVAIDAKSVVETKKKKVPTATLR